MTKPYQGRHGASHRTATEGGARPGKRAFGFVHALRRPVAGAAAVVSVAGATAAGFASAHKPHTSVASFTASPVAVAQATELSANRTDTNDALARARRSAVQRASALTQQQKAVSDAEVAALAKARQDAAAARSKVRADAAAARSKVREDAAAALAEARRDAADRSSREQAREGLLDRAQSDPQAAGRLLAADRGWGSEQFDCLESLWEKESGWRWDADNPSSDAYGIPQALPGSKMSSFGSDWETNPITQIKWGLQYISSRYGTPCDAWSQSQSANWY